MRVFCWFSSVLLRFMSQQQQQQQTTTTTVTKTWRVFHATIQPLRDMKAEQIKKILFSSLLPFYFILFYLFFFSPVTSFFVFTLIFAFCCNVSLLKWFSLFEIIDFESFSICASYLIYGMCVYMYELCTQMLSYTLSISIPFLFSTNAVLCCCVQKFSSLYSSMQSRQAVRQAASLFNLKH